LQGARALIRRSPSDWYWRLSPLNTNTVHAVAASLGERQPQNRRLLSVLSPRPRAPTSSLSRTIRGLPHSLTAEFYFDAVSKGTVSVFGVEYNLAARTILVDREAPEILIFVEGAALTAILPIPPTALLL
jgi:hypothetical protein